MALPTYKKQTQRVATPRQTAGGTSTAGFMASAQASQSLAQRLSSFSQQLHGVAGGMAQDQAAKDATVDIYKRKQEVNNINAKDISEAEKAQQIRKITEGAEKNFIGVYSKAYNSAATAAYSNQIRTDAKSAFDLAMIQANGDPDTFMKAYSSFSQETVRGAPTEATSILAQQTTMGYGTAGYKSLMLAKMGANKTAHKASYKNSRDAYTKQFSDAYYSGDSVEIARIGAVATASGEAAVREGLITQSEHEVNLSNMADRAIFDSAKRKFGESVNEGMGTRFYMQFRSAEAMGEFETQDPEEIAKFKSSMLKQIKEHNDSKLIRDKYEAEKFDTISDSTFRMGTKMAASGTLTEAIIAGWETDGSISTANADNLRERNALGETRKFSDALTLGRYNESTVLLDTDNETIKNDTNLSEPDKTSLLTKKEGLLEGQFNWRTTNDGREAVRRIKSRFGIQEGTLMAKIDLNNQTMRDFDNLYKAFYAEVSQSENPSIDVLTIADKMLGGYEQKLEDKRLAGLEKDRQDKIEEAKNTAAAYNDTILVKIGWSDPVSYEDVMMEK